MIYIRRNGIPCSETTCSESESIRHWKNYTQWYPGQDHSLCSVDHAGIPFKKITLNRWKHAITPSFTQLTTRPFIPLLLYPGWVFSGTAYSLIVTCFPLFPAWGPKWELGEAKDWSCQMGKSGMGNKEGATQICLSQLEISEFSKGMR